MEFRLTILENVCVCVCVRVCVCVCLHLFIQCMRLTDLLAFFFAVFLISESVSLLVSIKAAIRGLEVVLRR